MVELQTLKMGLKLGVDHNLSLLVINIDSSNIANCIDKDYISCTNLILECMSLIQMLGTLALMHIYKKQNKSWLQKS